MTEHEKMLGGKLYDPCKDGLAEERARAHWLCKQYNDLPETDAEGRDGILHELIGSLGEDVYLQGPIFFDYGTYTSFGDRSYANFNLTVLDICKVTVGKNVFIGPNVSLLTPIHPLRWQDRNLFFNEETGNTTDLERGAPITIKDNCWLAGNVTVCGGVTIGEGCVIGAGSVVTRDIPPNTLAVGVPCRVIREITEEDSVKNHPEWLGDPNDLRFFK